MIKTQSASSKSSEINKAYDRYMVDWCLTSQESFLAVLHLFLTYGRLGPEDIKYCHS